MEKEGVVSEERPQIPNGWKVVPVTFVEYVNRKILWMDALEAAGLYDNSELIEQAQEIMKQWEEEDK